MLYTGVTSDFVRRIHDHKRKRNPKSFTARYNVDLLVYYEVFKSIMDAIRREKQIKSGSRRKKESLIISKNPEWHDLTYDLTQTDFE